MTNEQGEARAQRLPEVDRQLFESFRRLGMSADAALSATTGRDRLPSTDPAETMVESFEAGFLQQGRTPDGGGRYRGPPGRHPAGGSRDTQLAEARNVAALLSPAERRKLRLDPANRWSERAERLLEAGVAHEDAWEWAELAIVDEHVRGGGR